jgi:hypothetical protein
MPARTRMNDDTYIIIRGFLANVQGGDVKRDQLGL